MSYSSISSQHQPRTTTVARSVSENSEMLALRWSRVGINVSAGLALSIHQRAGTWPLYTADTAMILRLYLVCIW